MHKKITITNRHRSTCLVWRGKPKALGCHTSSSRAESASGFLLSKRRAGKSTKCLGPTVSKQVRGIWRDEEMKMWGRSEGEKCLYLLLRTKKKNISWVFGKMGVTSRLEPKGAERQSDRHFLWFSHTLLGSFSHSGTQAQDFLAWFYRHKTKEQWEAPLKRLLCSRRAPAGVRTAQQWRPWLSPTGCFLLKKGFALIGFFTPRPTSNFVKLGKLKLEQIQTRHNGF